MSTKTTPTPYGEIEFETVECDSCGDELLEKNAKEFTIGDREGLACEYCTENGPIDFPGPRNLTIGPFLLCVALWPLVTWWILQEVPDDTNNDAKFYFVGVVGGLIYGGLFAAGVIYLL